MRDLASGLGFASAIDPAVYAADEQGHDIDLLGFNSALLDICVGAGGITFDGSNKIEIFIEHADDNGSGAPGTYAPIDASDINGPQAPATVTGGIVESLIAAHAATTHLKIGYIGNKRWLRVTANFTGTHGTGTAICVTAVKGHPADAPVA